VIGCDPWRSRRLISGTTGAESAGASTRRQAEHGNQGEAIVLFFFFFPFFHFFLFFFFSVSKSLTFIDSIANIGIYGHIIIVVIKLYFITLNTPISNKYPSALNTRVI
jgi:hypothetical protein